MILVADILFSKGGKLYLGSAWSLVFPTPNYLILHNTLNSSWLLPHNFSPTTLLVLLPLLSGRLNIQSEEQFWRSQELTCKTRTLLVALNKKNCTSRCVFECFLPQSRTLEKNWHNSLAFLVVMVRLGNRGDPAVLYYPIHIAVVPTM